jgi:UDP-N-acetylmuramoyl-L-alanyl-D-glutamate--2,6-diaminopimelate ligase
MLLSDLIHALPLRPIAGCDPAIRVCDLTEDSRTVVPGSLFIARPGTRADGRKYIAQAIEAGAVAVVVQATDAVAGPGDAAAARSAERYYADIAGVAVLETPDAAQAGAFLAERFYGNPSSRLDLIGITGTNGKSTTAHIIHRTLNACRRRCGLIGTVEIDDGVSLSPAEMTTPPATEISRTLGVMVEQGCRAAAMEVSSHALDQRRAAALTFRVGVFTNLTRDHLNYHQTMQAYAAAKARLFAMLPADGVTIVNGEDPAWREMVAGCKARVITCARTDPSLGPVPRGTHTEQTGRASVHIRSASISGMSLTLTGPWGQVDLASPLVGDHNAINLLQAAVAMWAIGTPLSAWGPALARVGAPAGRLEGVSVAADDVAVFVDYAHTPDAMENVLRSVRRVAEARPVTIVFGAGGDKDAGKRPLMGEVAARLADRLVITSDNPRSESPRAIIAQIIEGVPGEKRDAMEVHVDRERAIHEAVAGARAGEIIVIAGKGHETEQVSVDEAGRPVSRRFDDREVAREALAARRAAIRAGV